MPRHWATWRCVVASDGFYETRADDGSSQWVVWIADGPVTLPATFATEAAARALVAETRADPALGRVVPSPVADIADRLLALVMRTRFRATGTSADPYTDALTMWLTVVSEARATLPPNTSLLEVEALYRDAVESWLRGEPSPHTYDEDAVTAQHLDDDDLLARFRAAVEP